MSGLALASAPAWAKPKTKSDWYDRAIIIDGLGGLGDPYGSEDALRYSDRAWAETVATGVTVVRDTVFPVGNTADPWGDYKQAIAPSAKRSLRPSISFPVACSGER